MKTFTVVTVLFLFVASPLFGATIYADPGVNGTTISQAVASAVAGDTVVLLNGTYDRAGDFDVVVDKDIYIESEDLDSDLCVIDLYQSPISTIVNRRAFYIVDSSPTIRGIKIINGEWHSCDPNFGCGGAAIYCTNASPTISHCSFEDNDAGTSVGGAIYSLDQSEPNIVWCDFEDNYADRGGAACFAPDNGGATFLSCTFTENSTPNVVGGGRGGAIATEGGDVYFQYCTFTDNYAGNRGGGAIYANAPVEVASSHFSGNTTSSNGGAIWTTSDLVLDVVRIVDCEALGLGGGIYLGAGTSVAADLDADYVTIAGCGVTLLSGQGGAICIGKGAAADIVHCTIVGNNSNGNATIYLAPSAGLDTSHCIIASNTGCAVDSYDSSYSLGRFGCNDVWGNSTGNYANCIYGLNGTEGNISSDPSFCGGSYPATYALDSSSPCLVTCSGESYIGRWGQGCGTLKSAPASRLSAADLVAVPNPFNPATEFQFNVVRSSYVTLRVFDIAGKEIATLVNRELAADSYRIRWDGEDASGRRVGSGVYFAQLICGADVSSIRVALLK